MFKTIIDKDGKDAVGLVKSICEQYTAFHFIILDGSIHTDVHIQDDLIFDCTYKRFMYFLQDADDEQKLVLENIHSEFMLSGCLINIGQIRGNTIVTSYAIHPDGSTDQFTVMDIAGIRLASDDDRNLFIEKSVNFHKQKTLN